MRSGPIHDGMPMVISRDAIDAWLIRALTDPQEELKLLAVDRGRTNWRRTRLDDVNSVQNNDPSLIEPSGDEPQRPAAEPQTL